MSELARIAIRDEDDLRVVEVTGELDASNADDVRATAVDDVANSLHGLVLDFRRLDYIDSAGIALVFDVGERLVRRGQKLALVVPARAVIRRALEVTGIDELAPIVPTLEAAREHVLPGRGERRGA
jgi:anti-sigma B factor antagonist